jgi:hypothetical protein
MRGCGPTSFYGMVRHSALLSTNIAPRGEAASPFPAPCLPARAPTPELTALSQSHTPARRSNYLPLRLTAA